MKSAIVIPARLESTRLPRKLLLSETGKSLIQHTWEAASRSELADQVLVATDSLEIFEKVISFGGQAVMTSPDHTSGSDRVAEASQNLDADIIVNLQGDEPETGGDCLDRLIHRLSNEKIEVATLATPILNLEQLHDTACVKVVVNHQRHALYFSRSPIPGSKHQHDLASFFGSPPESDGQDPIFLQHLGVYGFHRRSLAELPNLKPSVLEQVESLEQLRFLANGWTVGVEIVEHPGAGIDTAEDYAAFVKRLGNS